MLKILIIICVIFGIGVAVLFSYPQFKNIEKHGNADARPIETRVAVDIERVAYAIQRRWAPKAPVEGKFNHFQLAKPGDIYFPDDYQLKKYAAKDPLTRSYLE